MSRVIRTLAPMLVSTLLMLLAPQAAGTPGAGSPLDARPPAAGYEPFDLQAHRGGLGLVAESTLAAFSNALRLGVSTLELDVQITQDGAAVVTHDRQVAGDVCRDTQPAFPGDPEFPYVGDYVVNLTLAQVRTLDCGTQTLPQHPGQRAVPGARMPLLSEVFQLVKRRGAREVWLNIEIKVEAAAPEETAPREQFVRVVAAEVRDSGMADRVTIQSFDWGALMLMREVAPELPIVALTNKYFLEVGQPGASVWLGGIDIDDFGGSLVAAAASFGADAISPVHGIPQGGSVNDPDYQPYVTAEMVDTAHAAGMEVIPWTVDDTATMASLIEAGVDGLITNYPNRLRNLMAERGMVLPQTYPPRRPACAPNVDLLGFSDRLDKQVVRGTDVGGLSAIRPTGDPASYYALVDNQGSTPARVYTLRVQVSGAGLGAPGVADVTTLRTASGEPFTGENFDGEGLAVTGSGQLLIASETAPAIRHFAPDGSLTGELPVPWRFRVVPHGFGRPNSSFESLSLSPDGNSLFTANEKPLLIDGRSSQGGNRVRILRYKNGPDGFHPAQEYFYLTEPGQGVVEIVALSDQRLLVLERGYQAGTGNTVRVFLVSLDGAADVSDEFTLAFPWLRPVRKTLLVDIAQCPPSGAETPGTQRNPLLDNYEGMTLGPTLPTGQRTLLLVSDDNFNHTQVTRILALAITLRQN